jgi:C-terminal processing protease CtpA/Prc
MSPLPRHRLRASLVTLVLVAGWQPAVAAQQLSAADRAVAVARLWAEARHNEAAWDHVGADWDSALAGNLALANQRQSDVLFYRRLRRMVALLGDGEARIRPPASVRARVARPPLEIRAVERRPFIVDYAENDEMRIARPERLAEVVAIQGVPAESWIRDSVLPEIAAGNPATRWARAVASLLEGEKGTALHLQLRLPGGAERGASVTRTVDLNDALPPPLEQPPLEVDTLPGGVAWVRLNSLADPDVAEWFDRAFPEVRGLHGVILDVRENTGRGGGREAGYRILARLVDKPFLTSRWRTPQYRPAYRGMDMPDSSGAWFAVAPDTVRPRGDRPPFTGPMAMLASPLTAGAAEDLLVAFRNSARGPVVGEPSAGATGQVLGLPLGKGWEVEVAVTRDAFPDGTEFLGIGIAPELPVAVTVEDFLAGRDAVLERARTYITEKR